MHLLYEKREGIAWLTMNRPIEQPFFCKNAEYVRSFTGFASVGMRPSSTSLPRSNDGLTRFRLVPSSNPLEVVQELGRRLHAGDEQMVASAGTRHVT